MACCVCSRTCSHIGPHAFCAMHEGWGLSQMPSMPDDELSSVDDWRLRCIAVEARVATLEEALRMHFSFGCDCPVQEPGMHRRACEAMRAVIADATKEEP
jgi:hypothetical protein